MKILGDLGVSVETMAETRLVPFIDTIVKYLDLGDHRTERDTELMKILRHQILFKEIASPESTTRSSLEGLAQMRTLSLRDFILCYVLKLSGAKADDAWTKSQEDDVETELDRVCRNLCIPKLPCQSETNNQDHTQENYLGLDYLVGYYAQSLFLEASNINPGDAIADIRQSVIFGHILENNHHSLHYADDQESLHVCYMDLVRCYLIRNLELDDQSLHDKLFELLDMVMIEEPRDPFWYMKPLWYMHG